MKSQVLLAVWVTHVDRKGIRTRTGAEMAAGMIQVTESLFYKRKLKDSGLFSQVDPSLRGDTVTLCKYSWRINIRKRKELFKLKDNDLAQEQRGIREPLGNSGWKLGIDFQLS